MCLLTKRRQPHRTDHLFTLRDSLSSGRESPGLPLLCVAPKPRLVSKTRVRQEMHELMFFITDVDVGQKKKKEPREESKSQWTEVE